MAASFRGTLEVSPRTEMIPYPQSTDTPPQSAPSVGPATTNVRWRASSGLGVGLVDVPSTPHRDPASATLADPMVPERKRHCARCGEQVGRTVGDRPGATDGICNACGAPFTFRPSLARGDVLGQQYEVYGCLAYGGIGWIYLARDRNVNNRWVVLKGLINASDQDAIATVLAEQRFLSEVEHSNVVKIYNFVQHKDPRTGAAVGYIVMEYVGGLSLKQIAKEHHETYGAEPLPLGQVISYGLEILRALDHLHRRGLLYCDLKPDNVLQTDEQVKLIDLGAVRRLTDTTTPLYSTRGYSAPELGRYGASIASDLYTVGRTLAVMSLEFPGYTTKFRYSLPTPSEAPLLAMFDSYHRLLRRATHSNPAKRFRSATEMADQLVGVLSEVVATGRGRPLTLPSQAFGLESKTFGVLSHADEPGTAMTTPAPAEVVVALPAPQVDTNDPAAGALSAAVAGDTPELVEALTHSPYRTVEVRLRIVRAWLELGELARARSEFDHCAQIAPGTGDWRLPWHSGLLELAMNQPIRARASFEAVCDIVPGELIPKLAIGVSTEYLSDYQAAAAWYETVWRTDRSQISAAFGLARVYLMQGAPSAAVEVLHAIPGSSVHYVDARATAVKIMITAGRERGLTEYDLVAAAAQLEGLDLDTEGRAQLATHVLEATLEWIVAGRPGPPAAAQPTTILGVRPVERAVRFALERCYRALARLAETRDRRYELVNLANAVRPRTFF